MSAGVQNQRPVPLPVQCGTEVPRLALITMLWDQGQEETPTPFGDRLNRWAFNCSSFLSPALRGIKWPNWMEHFINPSPYHRADLCDANAPITIGRVRVMEVSGLPRVAPRERDSELQLHLVNATNYLRCHFRMERGSFYSVFSLLMTDYHLRCIWRPFPPRSFTFSALNRCLYPKELAIGPFSKALNFQFLRLYATVIYTLDKAVHLNVNTILSFCKWTALFTGPKVATWRYWGLTRWPSDL